MCFQCHFHLMSHKALREREKGMGRLDYFWYLFLLSFFTNLVHTSWHVFGSVAKTGQVHKEGPFSAETEKPLNCQH